MEALSAARAWQLAQPGCGMLPAACLLFLPRLHPLSRGCTLSLYLCPCFLNPSSPETSLPGLPFMGMCITCTYKRMFFYICGDTHMCGGVCMNSCEAMHAHVVGQGLHMHVEA